MCNFEWHAAPGRKYCILLIRIAVVARLWTGVSSSDQNYCWTYGHKKSSLQSRGQYKKCTSSCSCFLWCFITSGEDNPNCYQHCRTLMMLCSYFGFYLHSKLCPTVTCWSAVAHLQSTLPQHWLSLYF